MLNTLFRGECGSLLCISSALMVNRLNVRFSTSERRKIGKGDRGTAEISSFLKKSFESVILCEQFPRSQIDIFVQVENRRDLTSSLWSFAIASLWKFSVR